MAILGILCLFYYCLLGILLRRWDSTFSRFWVFAGICFLVLSQMKWKGYVPFLAVFFLVFLTVEFRILLGMVPCREKNIPYLIVLGAQVRGTKMSGSLYRRIEKARQYLCDNPKTTVIVSGGQGRGEDITEALAMERYLKENGIAVSRIFREEKSKTTEENLIFSARYVGDMSSSVGIVTNNFHMYRACLYAEKLGYKKPRAVPAGCHPAFFVNYMTREFFALCKMLLTKRKTML